MATPPRPSAANGGLPAGILDNYDTVVVGAGLSGMKSAIAASEGGSRVLLVDEYPAPGGHRAGAVAERAESEARDQLTAALGASNVQQAMGCSVLGYYHPGTILVGAAHARPGAPTATIRVKASSFIFATGSSDTIPLFENNDLPGVFGCRSLRLFLERDQLIPGRHAVVYGDQDTVAATLPLLRAHGISLQTVLYVDKGPDVDGIVVHRDARVLRANGSSWISAVQFRGNRGETHEASCDLLCVALRGQPTIDLAFQAGFRHAFDSAPVKSREDDRVMLPTQTERSAEGTRMFLVGESAGVDDWRRKLEHAAAAGGKAATKEPV